MMENYLLEHIPISSAMGIKVEQASAQKIILCAPLSNNINHKNTVFGGSLHAVATLACWSLLHVNLESLCEENFQIVIASSLVNYLAPVASDFKVECEMPKPGEWDRFVKILLKKGKARINLQATIFNDGQLCVEYKGVFAALKIRKNSENVELVNQIRIN
ncbi:MAG: YiiD C-terminal domain-containing protein [Parachlamydiaceae bacterium]|nr:YiiD C-terminal domain-containing protein [Parachlamydiaceae bacterium]